MDDNMRAELCVNMLKATAGRFPLYGATLHSGRGSQYTDALFRQTLNHCGVSQGLSGVDYCYNNARMENFFATLKKELFYQIPVYRMTMDVVKSLVFRYVFIYYNQYRVYTVSLGGLPPAVYRLTALGTIF